MPIDYLCNIDLKTNQLLNAVIHPVATAPSNPVEGQIYYDTTAGDKQLYVWNGTIWQGVAHIAFLPTEDTIASGDTLAFSDESESGDPNNNITIDNLLGTGLQHVTAATIVAGDYITFLDGGATGTAKKGSIHDVAALFAGAGLTATSSVIAVDTLNQDTTGTADKATHVLVSDNESTNEENEITFVEDAAVGGAQRGLESSAKATFNPSTGKITATGFVGALTGNATTATTLATHRTIGMTGDVTWTSAGFNGGGGVTGTSTIGAATVHHAMLNDDIISGQGAVTALAQDDLLVVHDTSAGTVNKITYSNFEDDIFGNVSGDGTIAAGGALVVTKSDGDFTVTGDLIVSGTTTTINTANLTVKDNNIILSSGNTTSAAIDGAGITLEGGSGSDATITYNTTGPKFEMKLGSSYEDLKVDTLIGDVTGDVTGDLTGNADTVTTNANLTGHITSSGNAAVLGSFTSAQLKTALTNETGSGAAVFATSPTLVTPALGTPASGVMTNVTGTATNLNIGGNAATSTKISSITNSNIVQLAGSQTLTGTKTLNSFKGTGGATVTNILDEDAMGSDSATALATQQSIKAYVDNTVAARTKSYNLIVAAGTAVSGSVASNSDKTWTITHAMGSSLLYMVQVIRTANGSGETVFPCVTRTTTTTVINFNVAPTSGDYTVVIVKI